MRWPLASLLAVLLLGCDQLPLKDIVDNPPQLPRGALRQVDLNRSPSLDHMLAWGCHTYVSAPSACALAGYDSKPLKRDMRFDFDLVFDLYNPNLLPIPLVELLLGMTVYREQNLGVLCVTFCDPEVEDCEVVGDPEVACRVDESEEVKDGRDFIPSVDDLVDLVRDVADGALDDNVLWRTLPTRSEQMCQPAELVCEEREVGGAPHMCCDEVCEPLPRGCTVGEGADGTCALCDGHLETTVAFTLDVDTTLGLLETLFLDGVDALLQGQPYRFVIPYTADGSMFFDVPRLGRKALGFGPFDDEWEILD